MRELPELPPAYDRNSAFGATYPVYTADQMTAYARQAVAAAMERAAQIAEKEQVEEVGPGDAEYNLACIHVAAAIRKETLWAPSIIGMPEYKAEQREKARQARNLMDSLDPKEPQ